MSVCIVPCSGPASHPVPDHIPSVPGVSRDLNLDQDKAISEDERLKMCAIMPSRLLIAQSKQTFVGKCSTAINNIVTLCLKACYDRVILHYVQRSFLEYLTFCNAACCCHAYFST